MDKFPDFELSSSRLIVSMEAVTDKDGVMSQMLEMESAARLALANSPIYALHNIDVSSDGEQLLLSGRLPSFYYKQLAQEAV